MSNNMDLGYDMFCYQCEQTAGGKVFGDRMFGIFDRKFFC